MKPNVKEKKSLQQIERLIDRQLDRIERVFSASLQIVVPETSYDAKNLLLDVTRNETKTINSFIDFSLFEQELLLNAMVRAIDVLEASESFPKKAELLRKAKRLRRALVAESAFKNNQYDFIFFTRSIDVRPKAFDLIRHWPIKQVLATNPADLSLANDDVMSMRIARGKLRNIVNFVLGVGIERHDVADEPVELFLKKVIHDGLLWSVLFTTFRDIYDQV